VESVRAQRVRDVELLVVDNGSTDGTVTWLDAEGVPHVALARNSGFAAAVNLGAARTSAPYVLVLNADAVLEPDCLERLVPCLESDPGLGGVQPRILQLGCTGGSDDPSAIVYSLGQRLSRDGRAFEISAGLDQRNSPAAAGEVFGVCGAACLLRRELFDDLGGYDERYFAFYEDVDLNVRARMAGWRFRLEPSAVVWHRGAASWRKGFAHPSADNARLVARNRLATQVKFMPVGAMPRISAVELGALARAARERRFGATAAGKLAALRWLGALRRERRRLRETGDPARARAWLGR
jgi:GT2 family glycosyltransferase